jgi:hypothetical protein
VALLASRSGCMWLLGYPATSRSDAERALKNARETGQATTLMVAASLIQAWTMSKHFRPWNIDQTLLLPPNVRDFVPKDHVSRFIVGLVRESLDLKAIMGSYVSGLGQPPFDPRMMVSLLQTFDRFARV